MWIVNIAVEISLIIRVEIPERYSILLAFRPQTLYLQLH